LCGLVTRDLVLLLALVVTGAAWAFAHMLLWVRVFQTKTLPLALRLLAAVPPLVLFAAWRARARTGALIWVVFGLAYLCLRMLA
jgi:hypothetical protein